MMTEVWNPFDDGNPVYKELAKQTAINRKTWRIVGSIAAAMLIADQLGKSNSLTRRALRRTTGIGAYNNPYGIIRR
jgi:hypothetical protein|tara:strand:+ start:922 stop:1149 length:228 start_codon:yes stop_codon:yes gene_type:complete